MPLAMGVDMRGRRADEAERHGDVMRCKAPQRILLAPHCAEVEAVRIDALDPPENAVMNQLPELAIGRMELQDMPGHHRPLCRARRLDDGDGFVVIKRHGLLDEDMLAAGDRRQRQILVAGRRRGDDEGVDRRIVDSFLRRQGATAEQGHEGFDRLGVVVDHGFQRAELGEAAHDVAAPRHRSR